MGACTVDDTRIVPARHRLSVDDYHRMAEAGILEEDDRVELIDGDLIDMVPIEQDHIASVNGLTHALILACGDRAIVSVHNPAQLDRFSEPQPDVTLFRPRADNYRTGSPPVPPDILLLVEVADSSLRYDRAVKLPLYSAGGDR